MFFCPPKNHNITKIDFITHMPNLSFETLERLDIILPHLQRVQECDAIDLLVIALCVAISLQGIYVLFIRPLFCSILNFFLLLLSGSTFLLFLLCFMGLMCYRHGWSGWENWNGWSLIWSVMGLH